LKVYPNPATEWIFVEIPGQKAGETQISLISSLGATVYSATTAGKGLHQIDVSGIPPGFYLVRVQSGSVSMTGKVLISR
jgi:hypothetical protein